MHIRGKVQVKRSHLTGGVFTGLWQKQDDILSSNRKELLVLGMVVRIAVHKVSSYQTRDLEYFADSCNTPRNPPTIFHPSLIATIQQTYLLSLCALLSQQHDLSRNVWRVEIR